LVVGSQRDKYEVQNAKQAPYPRFRYFLAYVIPKQLLGHVFKLREKPVEGGGEQDNAEEIFASLS
jgi:hypothetical protein